MAVIQLRLEETLLQLPHLQQLAYLQQHLQQPPLLPLHCQQLVPLLHWPDLSRLLIKQDSMV